MSRSIMNIAHRGYSGRYPENTLLSFRQAIALGCRWLECDVRLTSDDVPVVIHDAKVDRTTNGTGAIAELAWEEIRELDAGSWMNEAYADARVPTLDELLDLSRGRAQVVIELKFPRNKIETVLETVARSDAAGWTVASAFEWDTILAARSLAPEWRATWLTRLTEVSAAQAIERCVREGVDTLGPVASRTDAALVRMAHDAGLIVRCWGLGDDRGPELRRLIEIGVDGMTTNWPDTLAAIIDELPDRDVA